MLIEKKKPQGDFYFPIAAKYKRVSFFTKVRPIVMILIEVYYKDFRDIVTCVIIKFFVIL